jgi:glycosyltransferase involved in cell wall biosynthesis
LGASGLKENNSSGKQGEILYVWPYYEWGGAQIYFIGLAKLARNFYRVSAAIPLGSQQKILGYLENQGIKCEFFDALADISVVTGIWPRIVRLVRNQICNVKLAHYLLKRGLKKTVVHAEIGPWASQFWLLYFLTFFCPVVVSLHISLQRISGLRRLEWLFKFWALSRRKRFHLIAANVDMRESLKMYVPEKFMETVKVAFTSVDVDEIETALKAPYNRQELCAKHKIPSDRFLIFNLAQVIMRKGPLVLLEAAKELLPKYPKLFFVWIGFGDFKQEFEKRIAEAGLSDSFRLIEPSEFGGSRLDLMALLRLADMFALPSYGEGLPIALIEAMALAKPSIATNVNAIPEAIIDRQTGLLVQPGDGRSLAQAIEELYLNERLRKQLSEAGRAHVLKTFDERLAAETTLEYYNACFRES